eukprot:CAMPEP_0194775328 /NCGR_PEP_ID=MMETSP0323_2-20130528/60112_1 /TAXON_ID=2866 ORGANISM="Crypthecodinium cohnii, Strain Seligo" /NCGR_SAMPLE_ID=MMETSP0323_2 /ASSEMBLY_ACC=CAM_ASM_000346 /LENGTH=86 /DNA_ID=CAMNT_0039711261 /DNA_START=80 /DNA_END=336 /DNA_ORIENTATION=-
MGELHDQVPHVWASLHELADLEVGPVAELEDHDPRSTWWTCKLRERQPASRSFFELPSQSDKANIDVVIKHDATLAILANATDVTG